MLCCAVADTPFVRTCIQSCTAGGPAPPVAGEDGLAVLETDFTGMCEKHAEATSLIRVLRTDLRGADDQYTHLRNQCAQLECAVADRSRSLNTRHDALILEWGCGLAEGERSSGVPPHASVWRG